MPIYAYKCASCGFAKDVLQKLSDPVLTVCPRCGQGSFAKQVTAAGFQLKGSGWYVTDFRDGGTKAGGAAKGEPAASGDGAARDAAPAAPAAAPAPAESAASAAPAASASGAPPASG